MLRAGLVRPAVTHIETVRRLELPAPLADTGRAAGRCWPLLAAVVLASRCWRVLKALKVAGSRGTGPGARLCKSTPDGARISALLRSPLVSTTDAQSCNGSFLAAKEEKASTAMASVSAPDLDVSEACQAAAKHPYLQAKYAEAMGCVETGDGDALQTLLSQWRSCDAEFEELKRSFPRVRDRRLNLTDFFRCCSTEPTQTTTRGSSTEPTMVIRM